MENASDLLSTLDRDGRMMYQSPPLQRLLGYDPEDLRGRSVFEFIHPDEREDAISAWKELVEEDGATLELPAFRFRHEDGSWRIWEATLTNLLSDPAVGAVLSNARDVTERIEMEEKMRQSQRLEAIGRLAGGVAHDFNNLLTVIRSQTDLLLLELEDSDPTASELEVIQSAADRAATLTNQLLAFSRDQVLRPRVVILCDVVRGTVGLVERVIGEDVRIETNLPGDRPPVEIDPAQLEQVVLNLAVNARDAMPDGGTLRLGTFLEEVDERTAREHGDIHPGAYTVLQVSDTGVGMDEETRSRAFEPFYTTKGGDGGTGLGLAMAYGFVKQSGGAIHVESASGEGATFYLRFPVVEREPEAVESSEVPDMLAGRSSGTVLVVEDDASVRRVVTKILERSGLDIVQAEDAERGLEILETTRTIDLILTDLVLPGLSGRALAARLRETHPDVPVIVMSGYAAEAPDHPGDLPTEIPFIQKPFTPGTLIQTLRRSLRQGRVGGT